MLASAAKNQGEAPEQYEEQLKRITELEQIVEQQQNEINELSKNKGQSDEPEQISTAGDAQVTQEQP